MKRDYLARLALSFGVLGAAALLIALWMKPKTDLRFVFPRNPTPLKINFLMPQVGNVDLRETTVETQEPVQT